MDADLFPVSFEEISLTLSSSSSSYPNERKDMAPRDRENAPTSTDGPWPDSPCVLHKGHEMQRSGLTGMKPHHRDDMGQNASAGSAKLPPSRIPRLPQRPKRPPCADAHRSIDQSTDSVTSVHSTASRASGVAARAAQLALRQLDENASSSPEIPHPPVVFDFEKKIRSRSRPGSPNGSRPSRSRSQSPTPGARRHTTRRTQYRILQEACRDLKSKHDAMRSQVRQFLQTGCALLQTFGEAIAARCEQERKDHGSSAALEEALVESRERQREAAEAQAAAMEWRRRALAAEQASLERLETIRMRA